MTLLLKGSEFLKAWKKAKPLMLTDTGISDMLRKLPDDADSSDIKQFKKVAADLTATIRRSRPRRKPSPASRKSRTASAASWSF